MEDYAAKMARKSLGELWPYLTHYAEYREAAVVAAIDELARRGETLPDGTSELRETLHREAVRLTELEEAENARLRAAAQAKAAAAEADEPFSLFGNRSADDPETDDSDEAEPEEEEESVPEERPRLYSPTVILWFSVLFSFFSGGVLMALNLHRLRQYAAVWLVALFCVVYAVVIYSVLGTVGKIGNILNLPAALVFNLWFWPRYIGFRREFHPRNFVWPLIICLVLMVGAYYWLVQHGLVPNPFQRPTR